MINIQVLCLLLALICFILAAIPVPVRVNTIALGLMFWVLSILIRPL